MDNNRKRVLGRSFLNKSLFLRRYGGSFTVEAALVMPIVLGVILLAIYLAIYSHDSMAMEYALVRAASKCNESISSMEWDKDDALNHVEEYIGDITSNRLIGNWDKEVDVIYSDDYMEIVINGEMDNSQNIMKELISHKIFGLNARCRSVYEDERKWIRDEL